MYKHCILFILLLLGAQLVHGLSLSAEVDRKNIALNETLQLIVSADRSIHEKVDFDQLKHQFDVLNTQRNSQTKIVNSRISSSTSWILTLAPKEVGQLIIPSFQLKGAYSPAISINVTAANTQSKAQKDIGDVFLDMSVDKNSIYVQEQLLITFRLYYKIDLSGYDTEEFTLDNTTIEMVSENSFSTKINGNSYNVLEKVYIAHPQASGQLQIPTQSWRLEKSFRSLFSRSSNPYLYVKSDPITVSVKSIPTASTANYWLPSTAVTVEPQWQQQSIVQDNALQAKVGEPLNYQLTLSGNGLTAAQLPDITLADINGFTIYTDQAKTDAHKSHKGIIGKRTNSFVIIPRKLGEFTFPEIRLTWWNTHTNTEETIALPQKQIIVTQGLVQSEKQDLPTLLETDSKPEEATSLWSWQLFTILLVVITCMLIVLFVVFRKRFTANYFTVTDLLINSKAPTILRQSSKNAHFKIIQQAADNKNWLQLRHALIRWAQVFYNDPKLTSLRGLQNKNPALQHFIEQLENQLYGQCKSDGYNPSELLKLIQSSEKVNFKKETNKLNNLYG